MNILVTGATGAVGPYVVNAFLQAGYTVRTFSIDPPQRGLWPADVVSIVGDITDESSLKSAMQEVDAVVHMAALLHIFNPSPALQGKYDRINVGGTASVVKAAIRARVKRVILFSTIAVYGPTDGRIVTEATPPNPDTFYAQTKVAAERIVLEAKDADDRHTGTVLRLGAVYGPRIKGNYQRLLDSLARGRFVPIGKGSNRRTLIYVKDVARATVLALQHPAAAGRVFNVSDGTFHTLGNIIDVMCQALGRRSPQLSLPIGPMRFAAGLAEDLAHLVGVQSPIMRATIDKYTEDVAVDSQSIQNELGFIPEYDLLAGWKDAVQEMRRSGEL